MLSRTHQFSSQLAKRIALITLFGSTFLGLNQLANAEAFNLGSSTCGEECHQAEFEVWEASPHQASFEKFDDPSDELTEKVDAILAAVGDDDMTESATCTVCHFTMVKEAADEDAWADSGPSCESCHGAGSDHKPIHSESENDYDTRMAEAESKGMIRPNMKFDIAQNCNGCHAMARDEVDGDTVTALLDAGHPIKTTFELVQYSQGSVKHRFYAPDTSVNADMTDAELSNLFVQGQIAQLLAAHNALSKSNQADYQAAMKTRVENATAALSAVPGGSDFAASPSEASARALVKSVDGTDLTGQVGSLLPDPGSYIETE